MYLYDKSIKVFPNIYKGSGKWFLSQSRSPSSLHSNVCPFVHILRSRSHQELFSSLLYIGYNITEKSKPINC